MLQENDKIRKMIQEEERKKWAEENKDLLKEQEERFKEERRALTARPRRQRLQRKRRSASSKQSSSKPEKRQASCRGRLSASSTPRKFRLRPMPSKRRDDQLEQIQTLENDVSLLQSQVAEVRWGGTDS